jgi:Fur family transcriptional regulator, peroxide stress response regulator
MPDAKKQQMQLRLKARLEKQGGLLTQQRSAVYDYLRRVKHHPTAEEVFLSVKQHLPKISLATVYKNLEALVACGAASKLTYGDAAARYDIRTDHHYHARCLKCGSVRDVEPPARETLAARITPPTGFQVEAYRVELVGHCRQCSDLVSNS